MMQHHNYLINPLLASPSTGNWHSLAFLQWDIRRPPRRAARVSGGAISNSHLSQPGIAPAVTSLRIISDLLYESWVLAAHNPTGVTVEDILTVIHEQFHAPLTIPEWECMSQRERTRTEEVFYARCSASRNFGRTRNGGVRRVDCLLNTTTFAGLSSLVFRNNRWEIVLTLSRDFSARHRDA
ncbi:hypothetical protein PAXRUDRAFT_619465 [Paxillus rubicundulus Ve08.2h10]|uniref:DUF6699 domain-containing protein n=1 Tax=Paxillus rubicundulus Ve08.2h10 TaxID=930991 RepID=A0A0D0E8Z2_9AGAM|nr:hypothetical protein PAXRUDRAFT_619465 [Paxillus rubicundulus Ve08.2h10]